jgi:hypothetical protein
MYMFVKSGKPWFSEVHMYNSQQTGSPLDTWTSTCTGWPAMPSKVALRIEASTKGHPGRR